MIIVRPPGTGAKPPLGRNEPIKGPPAQQQVQDEAFSDLVDHVPALRAGARDAFPELPQLPIRPPRGCPPRCAAGHCPWRRSSSPHGPMHDRRSKRPGRPGESPKSSCGPFAPCPWRGLPERPEGHSVHVLLADLVPWKPLSGKIELRPPRCPSPCSGCSSVPRCSPGSSVQSMAMQAAPTPARSCCIHVSRWGLRVPQKRAQIGGLGVEGSAVYRGAVSRGVVGYQSGPAGLLGSQRLLYKQPVFNTNHHRVSSRPPTRPGRRRPPLRGVAW